MKELNENVNNTLNRAKAEKKEKIGKYKSPHNELVLLSSRLTRQFLVLNKAWKQAYFGL